MKRGGPGRRFWRVPLLIVVVLAGLVAPPPAVHVSASPLLPAASSAAVEEPLVVRVYFDSIAERDLLAGELDVTEELTSGGYLGALVSETEYQGLLAQGYRVEIDQARTALLRRPAESLPGQANGISGFPCYRTVEETYASLAQLAADHSGLATWIDIGDSWEKVTPGGAPGYDLRVLILTNKSRPGPKPIFFLMAAIHAREYTTAEMAARYAEYLVSQYGADPDITWLLDYFEVHILPQANPDGRKIAEGGVYQRKNTNNTNGGSCQANIFNQFGTDINRNSSYQWGGAGSSNDPCSEVYRGPAPTSEPETQAIQAYVASIFPDQRGPNPGDAAPSDASGVFISLHSYAQAVLFPWGGANSPAPNSTALETLGRKFAFFNGYRVCQPSKPGCLYPTTGTTDDWAYGELGLAAYTFEVGTDFFEDCDTFANTVLPGNLPALLAAFKATRRPYQSPAGPDTLLVSTTLTTALAGEPLTLTAFADDTRYASGGWGNEPSQAIAAARYSLDAPAWITGTGSLSMAAADGAFDSATENLQAALDTADWIPGRHLVFVESQDAAGNWGAPDAAFVWILPGDYYFTLAPPALSGGAAAGVAVPYRLDLTQFGAQTDTFTVTVAGNAWPLAAPSVLGPLAKGDTTPFTVTVTNPPGTPPGSQDTTQVTLTSAGNPSLQRSALLVTTVYYQAYLPIIAYP